MPTIDRAIGFSPEQEIVREFFTHRSYRVLELIVPWPKPDKPFNMKLIWVREALELLEVAGRANPCSHCEFEVTDDYRYSRKIEQAARRKVIKLFEDYWIEGRPLPNYEQPNLVPTGSNE